MHVVQYAPKKSHGYNGLERDKYLVEAALCRFSGSGAQVLRRALLHFVLDMVPRGFTLPFRSKAYQYFKLPRCSCSSLFPFPVTNIHSTPQQKTLHAKLCSDVRFGISGESDRRQSLRNGPSNHDTSCCYCNTSSISSIDDISSLHSAIHFTGKCTVSYRRYPLNKQDSSMQSLPSAR